MANTLLLAIIAAVLLFGARFVRIVLLLLAVAIGTLAYCENTAERPTSLDDFLSGQTEKV